MCTEHEHKIQATLETIERLLKRQPPEQLTCPISDAQAIVFDYRGRKYLYIWSPVALTLNLGDQGTLAVSANTWTDLTGFKPNMRVTTSGYGNVPAYITLLATNDLIVTATSSGGGGGGGTVTSNAGTGWTTSGLALESGGNLASILTQLNKLSFSGSNLLTQSGSRSAVALSGTNPTTTGVNTDASVGWNGGATVTEILIANNTTVNVIYELGATTNAGSDYLAPGQKLNIVGVALTSVHVQAASSQNINGSTAGNIVIRGWA